MTTVRWFLVAWLLGGITVTAQGQADRYWLIQQVTGDWEYRDGAGNVRKLAGPYDYVQPSGAVRCLGPDVAKCALHYLASPWATTATRLPVPLRQGGQWVPLKVLPPPPLPILPASSDQLVRGFTRRTQPGGSRAVSGCEGTFPLRAPACGEDIDLTDFKIRWQVGEDASTRTLLVFVRPADREETVRRFSAPISAGEYSSVELTNYLRGFQSTNQPVDVVIKVSADATRSASRLVHIPSAAKAQRYANALRQIAYPDPVLRSVAITKLAIEANMWSRAAEEGLRLTELVSGSPVLMEYVMAGLCQSDFEESKMQARQLGPTDLYERICQPPGSTRPPVAVGADQAVRLAPPPAPEGAPATGSTPADGAAGARGRLGIALLIGNWEYASGPLYSVRQDLQHMKAALEGLGFVVIVRENLRRPQEFREALDRALIEERATFDDILFVYYSGHGVQIEGKSYLLSTGVSSKATSIEQIQGDVASAEQLMSDMEGTDPGTRILMIEACRDGFLAPTGKGGFAFRPDDLANTFVMFANKPGAPTPARSDEGEMGPFTESFIQALQNSSGEILDVFRVAAEMTRQISPGQEPEEHHSRKVTPVLLRPRDAASPDQRAKELLVSAEPFYRARSWQKLLAKVDRGHVLASSPDLQRRLEQEGTFARLAADAEVAETGQRWKEAAGRWQQAGDLFPVRQWATMNAAVDWLLAGEVAAAARALGLVSARGEGGPAPLARNMLADLVKAFPGLDEEAAKAALGAGKVAGEEFEVIKDEE